MKRITEIDDLASIMELSPQEIADARRVIAETGYPLAVTESFLARTFRYSELPGKNPLFAQFFPSGYELNNHLYFTTDPLKEQDPVAAVGQSRLLRKYSGRGLLLVSGQCFGNCRFCFRRHTFRSESPVSADFSREIAEIAGDATLSEIIFSGGDPLTASDEILKDIAAKIMKIPHIQRIRIHTRTPIFSPERISENFVEMLQKISRENQKMFFFVLHTNHPAELADPEVHTAISRLAAAGFPLLQQGVLLRGVNDNADTLAELYETLISLRVLPYYLHQLDRVAGAAHFEVEEAVGREIFAELKKRLPGYAVPRYVREVPGEAGKVEI